MSTLVLTVVGDDRAGLVKALADVVASHGGNWERSELAELAGTFAGIVLVTVPADRAQNLVDALAGLDGLLKVTTRGGSDEALHRGWEHLTLTVLGNDRPGIVRDVSAVLDGHAISIDSMTSRTLDAPMSGGTLFEATVIARVPRDTDLADVTADLERLAAEIQVDLVLDDV